MTMTVQKKLDDNEVAPPTSSSNEIDESIGANEDWSCLYDVKMDSDWDITSVFGDVEPLLQNDGPAPVCRIAYKPSFEVAMNYFRAIIRLKEFSKRSFQLTSVCLKHNPANYTVWHYRRLCLTELSSASTQSSANDKSEKENSNKVKFIHPKLVELDLEFTAQLVGSNPKNYQVWYHRRALLENLLMRNSQQQNSDESMELNLSSKINNELAYVASVFSTDAKNYHAWSHRQWLLRTVTGDSHVIEQSNDKIWQDELDFAHSLLLEDMRNNSAWNHRWFVCHRGGAGGRTDPLNAETMHREAQYALHATEADPFNESPWRFLIGLLKEHINSDIDEQSKMQVLQIYDDKIQNMSDSYDNTPSLSDEGKCHFMLGAHLDIWEMIGSTNTLEKAASTAHDLALEHDTIRRKYWLYREKILREKKEKLTDASGPSN